MSQYYPISTSYELVAILWDCQNVRVNPEQVLQLLGLANIYGIAVYKKAYANWHQEILNFSTTLYKSGFDCLNIPLSDNNAVDNKLKADCEREVINDFRFKTVFIVSKDKDYVDLVNKLHSKEKTVIIVSESPASKKLQSLNIDCLLFNDLPNLITNQTQPQSTTPQTYVTYKNAIQCLIDSVETCLQQNKPTKVEYIASLMWKNTKYPYCTKTASMLKPDGGHFSSFKEFIDAAVKDGKIIRENQELFIIDKSKLAA